MSDRAAQSAIGSIQPERWRLLSRHIDHVLELPQVEWADYVAALARSDLLTATELEALLHGRQHRGFSEFLAAPGRFVSADAAAATLIGLHVGPYVIDAEVGGGGMGSVWRARRADGRFEGRVAIKLLHLGWLGRSGEQRFRLEGRLLARLDHPNIARLIDAGVLEGGQPYLVLEYIDGETIDVYCERRGLGIEARIRLLLDAMGAVEHAHRHLIVHRDLKPSNMLVTPEGTVKLLDFGIAKLLREGAEGAEDAEGVAGIAGVDGAEPASTRSFLRCLTPRYAAPEQLTGEPVTTATDVFALGLMLYTLLARVHPFDRRSEPGERSSDTEIMHAMLETVPPRASLIAAGPAAEQRALQGDLDNILAKALKRAPAERYTSVGPLSEDLRRYLAHEPVHARPDTVAYRAAKFVRRHRAGVAAGLGVVLTLLAAMIVSLNRTVEARRQRDLALSQLQRSQAFSDLVAIVLSESSGADRPITTAELLDRGERLVQSDFASAPALRAELDVALARLYGSVGLTGKQRELFQRAHAAALEGANPDAVALTACAVASADAVVGRLSGAADRVRRLLAGLPPGPGSDEARSGCLLSASTIATVAGDGAGALESAERADRILSADPAATRWQRLSAALVLADAQRTQGHFLEADATYQRVSRGFEQLSVDRTAMADTLLNNWSIDLEDLGRPGAAASLEERVRAREPIPSRDAFSRTVYASALVSLGRADEARKLLEPALADALANGNRRSAAMVQMGLAVICRELGMLDRAQAMYGELARELATMLPAGHEAYGALHLGLAQLAQRRLDHETALREAGLALSIFSAQPGLVRRAAATRLVRAESLIALHRSSEALTEAASALATLRDIAGPSSASFDVGQAELSVARAHAALGDPTAALQAARDAHAQLVATVGTEHPLAREAARLAHEP